MPLAAGDKLGPYDILGLIGVGGMGEVYRARDTRLKRQVAIKISDEWFSDRFEREAHSIAALNHPNICTLHDVGPNYLIMELVEGPTLADRIKEGPLPLDEVLAIARQIADALDAAHERGIVHRDLKPGNIKIKPDGSVKVLDFGLAKVAEPNFPEGSPEKSPTLTIHQGTQVGMILGTAAYMSPEQARGKPVDKRADIWAFGVVLFELLTGNRPFEGTTISDSLAAILKEEPDLRLAPENMRRLLRACLEKEPRKRLRDIGDAWRLMEDVPTASTARSLRWLWASALLALIAAGSVAFLTVRPRALAEPYRLEVNPPPGIPFEFAANRGGSVISPDGRKIAFVAGGALWVRSLDSDSATRIIGTEGAYYPFWSPDQRSIGFFVTNKLMRADLPSSPVTELATLETVGRNGSWSANGTILFSQNNSAISRIPSTGGTPEAVTRLSESESAHYHPSFFPDGDHYLYMVRVGNPGNGGGIYVGSLKDPALKRRVADALSNAAYVPASSGYPGYLVFDREGVLVAQPFDAKALRTIGEPLVLSPAVGFLLNNQFANFSASQTGTILFGTAGTAKVQLAWMDRAGSKTSVACPPDYFSQLRLSPDDSRVLLAKRSGVGIPSIWTFDFRRDALTLAAENSDYPAWSADGRSIIYGHARALVRRNLDSAGPSEIAAPLDRGLGLPVEWSPDGQFVVLATPRGLNVISLVNGGKGALLSRTSNARSPKFSPDGKWLAFVSVESGTDQVVVQDFPHGETRIQVSNHGGIDLEWRRDGKELFYLTMDRRLMAIDVRPGATRLQFGVPHALFSAGNLSTTLVAGSWDAASDGQHFLGLFPVDANPRDNQLTVLLNWRAAIRQ